MWLNLILTFSKTSHYPWKRGIYKIVEKEVREKRDEIEREKRKEKKQDT